MMEYTASGKVMVFRSWELYRRRMAVTRMVWEQNIELVVQPNCCIRMTNAQPNHVANVGTRAVTGYGPVLQRLLSVNQPVTRWTGCRRGLHWPQKDGVSLLACLRILLSTHDEIH